MNAKIKKQWKKECECYMIGTKIVCFLVGRFLYLGSPSQNRNSNPDDYKTIKLARIAAAEMCEDYLKGIALSKSCGRI